MLFQLFLLGFEYSFFQFNNFLVSRIETFPDLLYVPDCLIAILHLSQKHFHLLSPELFSKYMKYCSYGIPTQMQWYHFVHPPSHSRPSKLSTISLQTPHIYPSQRPYRIPEKASFCLHYTFEPIIPWKFTLLVLIQTEWVPVATSSAMRICSFPPVVVHITVT